MLTTKDIIEIEIDNQWIEKGLNYALISWTSTFNRMGKPNPYSRVEKILLGIIAENALEKYLLDNGISYETQGKTKWYEVDRYDIGIKGYAVDVKSSFLDLNTKYISSRLNNLFINKHEWFLKCHALVPIDQFNPGNNERRAHKRDKIYIFPLIEGSFNRNIDKRPLVHTFWDYKWLKKAEYKELKNLGKLNIRYDGELNKSTILIYGTNAKNTACIEKISLTQNAITTENDFFQVFSIKWTGKNPNGELQISSPVLKIKEIIKPVNNFRLEKIGNGYWPSDNNWQSLALVQSKVFLIGWTNEENFRINGKELKRFTKTIEQYSETKVDNWGCLMKELEPMKKIIKV